MLNALNVEKLLNAKINIIISSQELPIKDEIMHAITIMNQSVTKFVKLLKRFAIVSYLKAVHVILLI